MVQLRKEWIVLRNEGWFALHLWTRRVQAAWVQVLGTESNQTQVASYHAWAEGKAPWTGTSTVPAQVSSWSRGSAPGTAAWRQSCCQPPKTVSAAWSWWNSCLQNNLGWWGKRGSVWVAGEECSAGASEGMTLVPKGCLCLGVCVKVEWLSSLSALTDEKGWAGEGFFPHLCKMIFGVS